MNDARSLPKPALLPDWFWGVVCVTTVVGSLLTHSAWFLARLAIIIMAQGVYLFGIARCPACSGKFSFHREDLPGRSTKYRLQLECKHCHVIWDTGRIRDDNVFFNS